MQVTFLLSSFLILLSTVQSKTVAMDSEESQVENTKQFCIEQNKEAQEFFKLEMASLVEYFLETFNDKITTMGLDMEKSLRNLTEIFNEKQSSSDLKMEVAIRNLSASFNKRLLEIDSKLDRRFNKMSESFSAEIGSSILRELETLKQTCKGFQTRFDEENSTASTGAPNTKEMDTNSTAPDWEYSITTEGSDIRPTTPSPNEEQFTSSSDSAEMEEASTTESNDSQRTTGEPQSTATPMQPTCPTLKLKSKATIETSDNLVSAGIGHKGEALYFCGALVANVTVIGKAIHTSNTSECWIAQNKTETASVGPEFSDYTYLTNPQNNTILWKPASKREAVPTGSCVLSGGVGNERYYFGRCKHGEQILPGPINEKTMELQVTFNHKVFTCTEYEILTSF